MSLTTTFSTSSERLRLPVLAMLICERPTSRSAIEMREVSPAAVTAAVKSGSLSSTMRRLRTEIVVSPLVRVKPPVWLILPVAAVMSPAEFFVTSLGRW